MTIRLDRVTSEGSGAFGFEFGCTPALQTGGAAGGGSFIVQAEEQGGTSGFSLDVADLEATAQQTLPTPMNLYMDCSLLGAGPIFPDLQLEGATITAVRLY
ncbi:hypothetical protein [Microcella sp.]|uniref:hypothetical protein n=1 Tax=Microcella sp. TaxID=1913979 RepID=UPI002564F5D0|nr:hypothetical protein [Microcella sp.]MBX9472217.1 hypothetical protein [Microcella sp.]